MDAFLIRKTTQSDNKDSKGTGEPPSKRAKKEESHGSDEDLDHDLRVDNPLLKPLPGVQRLGSIASGLEDDETPQHSDAETDQPRRTAIESSLPEVKSGKEALEEYENFRASQANDNDDSATAQSRLESRKWVRGKTSLYVDAFNLALSTVLDEESHLFDEKEMYVFNQWNNLSYEAQFLYVIEHLQYPTLRVKFSFSVVDMYAYSLERQRRGIEYLACGTTMTSRILKQP